MYSVRRLSLCAVAFVVVLGVAGKSEAARIWIDPATFGQGNPIRGNVPTVNLDVGQTVKLGVWVSVGSGVGGPTVTSRERVAGLSFDLDVSNPGVVLGVSHTVVNPFIGDPDDGERRWDGVVGGLVNVGNRMVTSARGFSVTALGIDSGTAGAGDNMIHAGTGARYFSELEITATAPGQTGLFFRVSDFGSAYKDGTALKMFFGNSDTQFLGNQFGAGPDITNMGLAHAIINVAGGPPPSFRKLGFVESASGNHLHLDVNQGRALTGLNVTGPGTLGISNHPGEPDGNLRVFFQLGTDNLADVLSDLLTREGPGGAGRLLALNAINGSPFLPGANVLATFDGGAPRSGSGDVIIEFDFGAGAVVQGVAVPEPSTLVLAGMGLVGLVGYGIRRRRSA